MENHPIPQDITGFQFKLIGNMTIKQFIYLAVGAIIAWVIFFIIKPPFIIKFPLSIIALSSGAIVAFVPIDGRPMDQMLGNFFRAIVSPTKFIYQKGSVNPQPIASQPPATNQASTITLNKTTNPTPPMNPSPALPVQTQGPIPSTPAPSIQINQNLVAAPITPSVNSTPPQIVHLATPQQVPAQVNPIPSAHIADIPIISEEEKKKDSGLINQAEIEKIEKEHLQKQIEDLKKQLEESRSKTMQASAQQEAPPLPIQAQAPIPTPAQSELEKALAQSQRQKEALEKQILEMKAKSEASQKKAYSPTVAKPLAATQRIRSVPIGMEKTVGIPSVSDAPNLITGIVKDPRGNPLPNILIEVKDQDSNPVRAFKTNGLGKFASATSLSNGKYLITFEDSAEKNKFDSVEIELTGNAVMPLEIISVDPREELRRELFA